MRELLDARDTARDTHAAAPARDGARQKLAAYATSAAERCDKLRRQAHPGRRAGRRAPRGVPHLSNRTRSPAGRRRADALV
jgi:hypothetical protein